MENTNNLLNEKYRPTELKDYVGNGSLKSTIAGQLYNNDIQNYLFYGPAGTGKTTLAKLIVNKLDCDHLYINASDERGIETIRDKVSGFASVVSFKPLKVVILDEADFLTIQAQASLRNIIETFSRTTRFILTCNYIERVIDPLQSRCQTIKVVPPTKKEVAVHIASICDSEGISYEPTAIGKIVNKFYPDLRKMLNTVQASNIENKLTLDDSLLVSTSYLSAILDELKKDKPKFNTIRQIIADSNIDDFEEVFRFLYDKADKYLPGKAGTAAFLINEHQYKANFRIDKEINIMSLINNLINNK
ncbi:AAA family ATPase [Robiginitalea sp.]|jgi:DNA polymerase III delta prime subunit|nr:AAA family ATPase [Robiginitalea sp.]|tara:strand:+ start:922 stop:1833 length:912 start_codon:yes stop_codon:yes gene_type:complete